MSFDSIRGQDRAKRILRNGLSRDRLSHAYIFSGPVGSGRKRMAVALAKAVFCENRRDGDSCGECLSCRKIDHGNHPGLFWLEPDGASIKIDQIRDLQKQFAYRTTQGSAKIYIMTGADKMTVQAANSLLKFLEEPGTGVIAILIADNGRALLPTIQSRAQWVPFVPASPQETAEELTREGLPPSLVLPAVRLTAGSAAARDLVASGWFAEARTVMLQLAKETLTRFSAALLTVQQKLVKSDLTEHVEDVLDLWMLWCKDMIRLQIGEERGIVYIDQIDWMRGQAFAKDAAYWVRSIERLGDAQKRLRFNANPQLALEKLIIDLQGV